MDWLIIVGQAYLFVIWLFIFIFRRNLVAAWRLKSALRMAVTLGTAFLWPLFLLHVLFYMVMEMDTEGK